MLTLQEFHDLARVRGAGRVSIFLPTHREPNAARQDPIRLKNLLSEARERCADAGLEADAISELLRPVEELLDDSDFWRHQKEGLALFAARDELLVQRLPVPFEERVVVGDRFHLRPLLPAISRGRRYLILALSQGDVRLIEGGAEGAEELDRGDIPRRLGEVVGDDWEQKSLQYHTGTPGRGARRPAVFHGHGAGSDDTEAEVERFLRRVDEGLLDRPDAREKPLVLAAVDELQAAFRDLTQHPDVLAEGVSGNPDESGVEQLHAAAWELAEPHLERTRRAALERVSDGEGNPRVVAGLEAVLRAAFEGRVETLVVQHDHAPIWGTWHADRGTLEIDGDDEKARTAGSDDLLDLAVSAVVGMGGRVVGVTRDEAPTAVEPVAALLRFPESESHAR